MYGHTGGGGPLASLIIADGTVVVDSAFGCNRLSFLIDQKSAQAVFFVTKKSAMKSPGLKTALLLGFSIPDFKLR
jgi:hypothetical protein